MRTAKDAGMAWQSGVSTGSEQLASHTRQPSTLWPTVVRNVGDSWIPITRGRNIGRTWRKGQEGRVVSGKGDDDARGLNSGEGQPLWPKAEVGLSLSSPPPWSPSPSPAPPDHELDTPRGVHATAQSVRPDSRVPDTPISTHQPIASASSGITPVPRPRPSLASALCLARGKPTPSSSSSFSLSARLWSPHRHGPPLSVPASPPYPVPARPARPLRRDGQLRVFPRRGGRQGAFAGD